MRASISRIVVLFVLLSGSITLPVVSGFSRTATTAPQSTSGLSADRLQRIDRALQQYVDENRLAGAVALVLRDGRTVYERAFGWSDKEAGRRMTTDTIFRIASQTKAITSAAILSLVEEGKIGINEPVSRHIPAYAHTTVAARNEGEMKVVPAKRPVTIRDLLTHTAGISYGTGPDVAALYEAKGLGPAAGFGWFTADKNEPICDTMERLATLPFASQPGEGRCIALLDDAMRDRQRGQIFSRQRLEQARSQGVRPSRHRTDRSSGRHQRTKTPGLARAAKSGNSANFRTCRIAKIKCSHFSSAPAVRRALPIGDRAVVGISNGRNG